MIRKMKITICLMLVFFWFGIAYSEGWSSKLGVVGGVSSLNDLAYFTSKRIAYGLGMETGGSFGVQYLLRKAYIGFFGLVQYHEFIAEGECLADTDPLASTTVPSHKDVSFRIMSLDLGLDLFFLDKGRYQPYLFGFISINTFGLSKITIEALNPSELPFVYDSDYPISNDARFGAGFGAGIYFSIKDWLETGLAVQFETFNLNRIQARNDNIYDSTLRDDEVSVFSFRITAMFLL